MQWIAPSEKDTDTAALEKRLWDAADQFRANSGLKSRECSASVLGLIFLRFAEVRFAAKRAQLESPSPLGGESSPVAYCTSLDSSKSNCRDSNIQYADQGATAARAPSGLD